MVSGNGTDAEIAARCAKDVPGWDKLSDLGKADMVRLMRHYHDTVQPPALDVVKGKDQLELKTPDGLNPTLNAMRLMKAMGTSSDALLNARLSDLTRYHSNRGGGLTSLDASAAFALIVGGNAADPVQSTLLTQMHCTNDAAIQALSSAGRAKTIPEAQLWGNLSVKLLNAYTRQADVLAKLQRGGEQVIKHVHIDNRGGQAMVTEQVITGGGVNGKSENQAYGQGALGPALLGSESLGVVVPMPSDQGPETMPVARMRTGQRRTEG